jgi:hypothetical protein
MFKGGKRNYSITTRIIKLTILKMTNFLLNPAALARKVRLIEI